jgi:hypothetical protein
MMRYARNQRGAATLIAVTLASFLIVLIVTAMTTMMIGELHQATDAESSVKAYYQSEGLAEEAMLAVKDKVNDNTFHLAGLNQSCDHSVVVPRRLSSTQIGDGATCLAIRTLSDGNQRFVLAPDQPTQLNLTSQNINQAVVTWDTDPVAPNADFTLGNLNGTAAAWQATGSPPPLEVTYNSFPAGGASFNATAVDTITVFLLPCKQPNQLIPGYTIVCPPTNVPHDIRVGFGTAVIIPVLCDQPAGSMRCRTTLSGLAVRAGAPVDAVLRIKPRFVGATYTLRAIDTAGNLKGLPLQYAQIDVTSKIGDAYRRVIHQVQIRSGAVGGDALMGDSDICKQFELFEAEAGYRVVNPLPPCHLN